MKKETKKKARTNKQDRKKMNKKTGKENKTGQRKRK